MNTIANWSTYIKELEYRKEILLLVKASCIERSIEDDAYDAIVDVFVHSFTSSMNLGVTRENHSTFFKPAFSEGLALRPKLLENQQWYSYFKIQHTLNNILKLDAGLWQKRTTDVPRDLSGESRLLRKFFKWAMENGVHCDGLKIQQLPDHQFALAAKHDYKKNDLLFSVPRKLMLTEEHLDKCIYNMPGMKLAFTLILEFLKPDSFWKAYINILPKHYNTVLYFTAEDMIELEGSNAIPAILEFLKNVASSYSMAFYFVSMKFKQIVSYELFRWAVSTVMTRENLIPRSKPLPGEETPSTIAALIPFWDMANHRNGTITSFFNVETQEMESKAQEDFKQGEQVFIHYGDRSNAELMTHNGFINAQNPKDYVSIKLGLSPSDVLFEKRNQLLQLLNIPKNSELKVLPSPEHISSELLGFVRVFNMNEEQLDHWIKSERATDLLHIDCALETELESKTWQYLQIRLMLLLKAFPTTLEDDEKLFEGLKKGEIKPERSYIRMMILEYRILEKRILAAALDYAKQRTKA